MTVVVINTFCGNIPYTLTPALNIWLQFYFWTSDSINYFYSDFQSFCSREFLIVFLDSCVFSFTQFWYCSRTVFFPEIFHCCQLKDMWVITSQCYVFQSVFYYMCTTLKCLLYCLLNLFKSNNKSTRTLSDVFSIAAMKKL